MPKGSFKKFIEEENERLRQEEIRRRERIRKARANKTDES